MSDSRRIEDLRPDVADKARRLIAAYAAHPQAVGELRPVSTLRTLDEQARLWRRSRTREEVDLEVTDLYAHGYSVPAAILVAVGPQPSGRWATNAPPGFSLHQWGLAFDVGVFVDGRYVDDEEAPYVLAGEIGEGLGLEWGGRWPGKKRDLPHFQAAGVDVYALAAERLRDGSLRGLALVP